MHLESNDTLNRNKCVYIVRWPIFECMRMYIGGWGGLERQRPQPGNRFVSFVRACVRACVRAKLCARGNFWYWGVREAKSSPDQLSLFPFGPFTPPLPVTCRWRSSLFPFVRFWPVALFPCSNHFRAPSMLFLFFIFLFFFIFYFFLID